MQRTSARERSSLSSIFAVDDWFFSMLSPGWSTHSSDHTFTPSCRNKKGSVLNDQVTWDGGRVDDSAELHSAGSRIFNPSSRTARGPGRVPKLGFPHGQPAVSRRYGSLQICAHACAGLEWMEPAVNLGYGERNRRRSRGWPMHGQPRPLGDAGIVLTRWRRIRLSNRNSHPKPACRHTGTTQSTPWHRARRKRALSG